MNALARLQARLGAYLLDNARGRGTHAPLTRLERAQDATRATRTITLKAASVTSSLQPVRDARQLCARVAARNLAPDLAALLLTHADLTITGPHKDLSDDTPIQQSFTGKPSLYEFALTIQLPERA